MSAPAYTVTTGPAGPGCTATIDSSPMVGASYADLTQSPCDGRLPPGNVGYDATYFLSPTTDGTSPTEAFAAGLAPYLVAEAVNLHCPPGSGSCANFILPDVTEDTDRYRTNWKSRKNGPQAIRAESIWRVKIVLMIPNTADATDTLRIPVFARDYQLSESPEQDVPNASPLKVIQVGSNENINFFVGEGALLDVCETERPISVECLIDDTGGTLTTTSGEWTAQLNIEPGLGTNTFRLEFPEVCASPFDGPFDVPVLSCAVEVTTDAENVVLENSSIEICADAGTNQTTYDNDVRVAKLDGGALTALPFVAADCAVGAPAPVLAQTRPNLLQRLLARLGDVIAPPALNATSVAGTTKAGGRLKDFSTFWLVHLPVGSASLSTTSAAQGDPITVTVTSELTGNRPVGETTFWLQPDTGGTVNGSSSMVSVTTDGTGTATASWIPAPGTGREIRIVSCGTAVSGSATPTANPTADFVLGNPMPDDGDPDYVNGGTVDGPGCDRDPFEVDAPSGANGYANGVDVLPGFFDPFVAATVGGVEYEVAFNDMPIVLTADVCGAPVIDGVKDDAWDCAQGEVDFQVNLSGGGPGSQPDATLRWFNDSNNLYFSLELPRSKNEKNTAFWVEFDQGLADGSFDNSTDEFDDLIGIVRKNFVPTFEDRYLDATCANSSGSSVCSPKATETAIDGEGGVAGPNAEANGSANGQFMFYELSHPLCSRSQAGRDAEQEDLCVSPGDLLGFFVRINVGNSPTGGTSYPGDRDYDAPGGPPITIQ